MDFKPLITITINNNYATDRACQQSLDQRELESSPISRREGIRPGRHILHVDVRFRVVGDTQALAWGDTRGAQDLSLSLIRARSLREQKEKAEPTRHPKCMSTMSLYFCIRRCDALNTC